MTGLEEQIRAIVRDEIARTTPPSRVAIGDTIEWFDGTGRARTGRVTRVDDGRVYFTIDGRRSKTECWFEAHEWRRFVVLP